jgi:hypothetical protein
MQVVIASIVVFIVVFTVAKLCSPKGARAFAVVTVLLTVADVATDIRYTLNLAQSVVPGAPPLRTILFACALVSVAISLISNLIWTTVLIVGELRQCEKGRNRKTASSLTLSLHQWDILYRKTPGGKRQLVKEQVLDLLELKEQYPWVFYPIAVLGAINADVLILYSSRLFGWRLLSCKVSERTMKRLHMSDLPFTLLETWPMLAVQVRFFSVFLFSGVQVFCFLLSLIL